MRFPEAVNMRLSMPVSMQIFHIMVVVLMSFIQHHMKIAHIKTGLFHPADYGPITAYGKTPKSPLQHLLICPQIQKRCHGHVSADPAGTLQIQYLFLHIRLVSCLSFMATVYHENNFFSSEIYTNDV